MKFIIKPARWTRAVVITAIFAATLTGALAKESALNFLKAGKPAASEVLAPPPLPDSAEQSADMETVKRVYHAAGSNDIAAAYAEKKFSVFNFTGAVGSYFIATNLPKTAAFFEKVQLDALMLECKRQVRAQRRIRLVMGWVRLDREAV